MKKSTCCPLPFIAFFLLTFLSKESLFAQETTYRTVHAQNTISENIVAIYGTDKAKTREFISAAIQLQYQVRIPAALIVGIAITESSFNSELYNSAGNPFGIKALRDWNGPTYLMYHDGEHTPFRVYSSSNAAILDFGAFLTDRQWYNDVRTCAFNDYYCILEGLKKTDREPGYSMDPNWDEKVLQIIEQNNLTSLGHL